MSADNSNEATLANNEGATLHDLLSKKGIALTRLRKNMITK